MTPADPDTATLNDAPANRSDQSRQSVLVVDSGLGGLSVLAAIAEKAPELCLHYVSDNAAFPYGEKTEAFLIERVDHLIQQAMRVCKADIIVIACNTASTVALPTLRDQVKHPIVGVVPAIKTASGLSDSRVFGLLATPGTVARDYTQQLIEEHASDCSVAAVGSTELVEIVEGYLYSGDLELERVKTILDQFTDHDRGQLIDTLVLGCTHFPLIADQIQALRPNWQLVDSGNAIARRVLSLLQRDKPLHPSNIDTETFSEAKRHIYFTDLNTRTKALDTFLETRGFQKPQALTL